MVEMATSPLERNEERARGQDRTQSGSKSTDGRIWYRWRYPKSTGRLHVLWIVGNGDSSRNLVKNLTST